MSILAGVLMSVALLPSVLSAHELAMDDNQQIDKRFQIFIAEHNSIVNGKPVTMKSIFKIDLDTGTVWRYRQGVDSKGKPFEEFFEVPNQ